MEEKEFFLDLSSKEINVYTFIEIIIVLFGRKNRQLSLLFGIKQIDRVFKYVKNIINENNLKGRIRFRLPKHESIDHFENEFMFDIETQNNQEFAEADAGGLYDENCWRDKWDIDLTVQEMKTERENVSVFIGSDGNPVMNML